MVAVSPGTAPTTIPATVAIIVTNTCGYPNACAAADPNRANCCANASNIGAPTSMEEEF